MKVKWHGDEFLEGVFKRLSANGDRVGMHLSGAVKATLSTGQPVRRSESGHTVGTTPADAGAPPRVLMGTLRQSVGYKKEANHALGLVSVDVGAHTKYARRLELGMVTGAGVTDLASAFVALGGHAHPYLRPTLARERKRIAKRFVSGLVPTHKPSGKPVQEWPVSES